MATNITVDMNKDIKELLAKISGCEEGTAPFNHLYKYFVNQINKHNTMYFLNKKEVDQSISGMSDKFNFHGFSTQAIALQEAYNNYIGTNLSMTELMNRLNVVKFLLCMSERPTQKFLENPERYVIHREEKKSEIDWALYLREGIEDWTPTYDSSDSTSSLDEETQDVMVKGNAPKLPLIIEQITEPDVVIDFRTCREQLLNTIQHTWYNVGYYFDAPYSDHKEANLGLLWEKFLEEETMGLIAIQKSTVLSEYKVIREILWQLFIQHDSATFRFEGDELKPRCDVTISSMRSKCFHSFLEKQFMPYINIMEDFRQFSKSMGVVDGCYAESVPDTYRSYASSLENLIRPVKTKLVRLEEKVRDQESTYTLITLASDLKEIFEPVVLLHKIHLQVIINMDTHSNLDCAITLISRLHNSLQCSVNNLDQNLRLTLLLDSLYHYFTVVNSWLMKNEFVDYSGEFPIACSSDIDGDNAETQDSEMNQAARSSISDSSTYSHKLGFGLNEEETSCEESGIIKIIRDHVLQIGRNLHLLRILGKYSLLKPYSETIHQEFVRKSLEEIGNFFNIDTTDILSERKAEEFPETEPKYKNPVIPDGSNSNYTDMEKLENLVDMSDGFLMVAFEEFFIEKPTHDVPTDLSLFEKVSKVSPSFFPVMNFFEKIFKQILDERFTVSGLVLKDLLVEKYLLEKQLEFLRHVFLFFDDLIFPFYRKLFEYADMSKKSWGNVLRLTSNLRDILMDMYPEFYKKCSVVVGDGWMLGGDPSESCNMVKIKYEVEWPLNIVIDSKQMDLYKEVFQFILKLKWGLYTVNHLMFTDIEPKKRHKWKSSTTVACKLKYLRFCITNILNSIQHYIFSFVFLRNLQKFELEFTKASDLLTIISSHADFINETHGPVMEIEDTAFNNLLLCIKYLKSMWTDPSQITLEKLNDADKLYVSSFYAINPIISPVYL
ncbi:unnamed protein product [Callosobruchus maculatus]|uniref:Gamma-tubulin complex component n=1 Tax=Callosobruchus maculatus TaxID=64391 RepID=A0A653C6J8_CALMS|nr:unnamed protein product [Callosobruchus maculatus]